MIYSGECHTIFPQEYIGSHYNAMDSIRDILLATSVLTHSGPEGPGLFPELLLCIGRKVPKTLAMVKGSNFLVDISHKHGK